VVTQDGQEIKVCVRTYRLFYVPEKEDFLWKVRSRDEVEDAAANLKKRHMLRKRWLDRSKLAPIVSSKGKGKAPAAPSAPTGAVAVAASTTEPLTAPEAAAASEPKERKESPVLVSQLVEAV